MSLPRLAPAGGLAIGDQTVLEGTILSVNGRVIHHSKEIWGEDAYDFRPDRWFEDDVASKKQYWKPLCHFITFPPPSPLTNLLSQVQSYEDAQR